MKPAMDGADNQKRTLHTRTDQEMIQLRADVVRILKGYSLENPCSRPDLATQLGRGITHRDTSELVAMVPEKLGEPVCSCGSGFYYGNTPEEIDAGVKFLSHRITGLSNRVSTLESMRDIKRANESAVQGRFL